VAASVAGAGLFRRLILFVRVGAVFLLLTGALFGKPLLLVRIELLGRVVRSGRSFVCVLRLKVALGAAGMMCGWHDDLLNWMRCDAM
jgi:hypothetical protein